jgi:carbamate kinase
MLCVLALGGNALLKRHEPQTIEVQRQNVKVAAEAIADVIRAGHSVVMTHGNGPQIGLLSLESAAFNPEHPAPLDVLVAETAGMIGYLLEQELRSILPAFSFATTLTMTEVDPADPAFQHPTKPIGPVYAKDMAEALARSHNWDITADGNGYRRVVPSPKPTRLTGVDVIRKLVAGGVCVICGGGGGVPVTRSHDGRLEGVEAVIDKDHVSALLAAEISADALLLLTDVDGVYTNWGKPNQRLLARIVLHSLDEDDLDAGSIGPKVEAASQFVVHAPQRFAGIGLLQDALAILQGRAGSRFEESLPKLTQVNEACARS